MKRLNIPLLAILMTGMSAAWGCKVDTHARDLNDHSRLSAEVNGAGTCPVGGDWLHPCPGGCAIYEERH